MYVYNNLKGKTNWKFICYIPVTGLLTLYWYTPVWTVVCHKIFPHCAGKTMWQLDCRMTVEDDKLCNPLCPKNDYYQISSCNINTQSLEKVMRI